MKIYAHRYHDISCGHRVVGHENKCRYLHGHNYRVHFYCEAYELDKVGRVLDFSVIKAILCMWLEQNWDHKMLLWMNDPMLPALLCAVGDVNEHDVGTANALVDSFVQVSFNPTAENMAAYLLAHGNHVLLGETNVILTKVVVEETRKCAAGAELHEPEAAAGSRDRAYIQMGKR